MSRVSHWPEGTGISANRILYVSYDPQSLVRDEQLLIRAGYEVDSVLGTDGLMACGSVSDYASVLVDQACLPEDRPKVILWLKTRFPEVNILPAEWAHEYAVGAGPSGSSEVLSEELVQEPSPDPQDDHDTALASTSIHEHLEYGSQKGISVDFRLLYRGALPPLSLPEQRQKQLIHSIRKHFHQQLQLLRRVLLLRQQRRQVQLLLSLRHRHLPARHLGVFLDKDFGETIPTSGR